MPFCFFPINVFKELKLKPATMSIKEKKGVEACSGTIKNLEVIYVLEHGSQQFTSYAATLRIAAKAWYFLPFKHTYWTIRVSLSITAVVLDVVLITNPLY
jgi:hypothetical protein